MRKAVKILMLLLLTLILVMTSTSCSYVSRILNYSEDIDHDGNAIFSYDYEDYEAEELQSFATQALTLMRDKASHAEVLAAYTSLMTGYYRLQSQLVAVSLSYNKNLYSAEASFEEQYMKMSALYNSVTADLYRLYAEAYDLGYGDIFFAGLSNEEIETIRKDAEGYDDELLSLTTASDELIGRYYEIEIVAGESDGEVAKLYAELAGINNSIARKFGYDNYLDYSYEMLYAREYSPEDVDAFVEYSIEYLLPVLESLEENYVIDLRSNVGDQLYDYYCECSLEGKPREELDAYFLSLGEKLNDVYQKFHSYDLYVAASDPMVAFGGAFTDYSQLHSLPVCYFGPLYQDRLTVVHEMGHFMRAYLTADSYQSYDAAELNSQGNEMLFLAYEGTQKSEDFYHALMESEIFDRISTLILSELINAFEYEVYTAEVLNDEIVLQLFEQTCERFGGYDYLCELLGYDISEYWQYVVIPQPGYYISYAVSMLPALELYILACEDYEAAVEAYTVLVSDPTEGLFDILEISGLSDPFDKETFEKVASHFMSTDFLK